MNFFGGPGEASHKTTVKKTGLNTQKRHGSFASQSSRRYFENLLIDYASTVNELMESRQFDIVNGDNGEKPDVSVEGEFRISIGKFEFGSRSRRHNHSRQRCPFGDIFFRMIEEYVCFDLEWTEAFEIDGFTCCKLALHGTYEKFRVTNDYIGREWRDFCMVQLEDGILYPSLIHGFFKFATEGLVDPKMDDDDDPVFVAVQMGTEGKDSVFLDEEFVSSFTLGNSEDDFRCIHVSAIVSPLMVFEDVGGHSLDYF